MAVYGVSVDFWSKKIGQKKSVHERESGRGKERVSERKTTTERERERERKIAR